MEHDGIMYLISSYRTWLDTQPKSVILEELQQGQAQVRQLEREEAEEDPRASIMLNIWKQRLEATRDAIRQEEDLTPETVLEAGQDDDHLTTRHQRLWLDPETLRVVIGAGRGKHVSDMTEAAFQALQEGQTLSFKSEPARRVWWLLGRLVVPYTIRVTDRLVKYD